MALKTASAHRTIIRPPSRWPGLGLDELWRFRVIALVLARRNLMVRYRQTLIGALWVLIQPLTLMLVFTAFFGVVMNRFIGSVPYATFLFSALTVWLVVSRILSQGSSSIVSNAGLLSKIYFPRVYLPISVAIASLVDLLFGMAALLAMLIFFGLALTIGVLTVPLLVLIALAAALGITFWLSALNAQYRDVAQLLPFLTQVWFFTTPILYPVQIIPVEWRDLIWLNPLAVAVEGVRWAFLGTEAPPLHAWIMGATVAAVLLVSGFVFFRARESSFDDVV